MGAWKNRHSGTLQQGDYININDIVSDDNLEILNDQIFQVTATPDKDTFTFIATDIDGNLITLVGVYKGGGNFARVSNVSILTKEFNFYEKEGYNCYLSKVEFLVTKTDGGSTQVDYFVSSSLESANQASDTQGNQSMMGTGTLDTFAYPTVPFEANAARVWHPLYFNGSGEYVQLFISMNEEQMRNPLVSEQIFELHALLIFVSRTNSRLQ